MKPLAPLRKIVAVPQKGAGCDRLLLECGHEIIADHKAKHPVRTRCHRCPCEE